MIVVIDFVEVGFVKFFEKLGGNVFGIFDYFLIDKILELVKILILKVKKIGVIYNISEVNLKI